MHHVEQFKTLKQSANPAMIIVTTAADSALAGCLVGFHAQSSMTPLQYSFWLSKANHTYLVALRASHFVAHFLSSTDLDVAEHFGASTGHHVNKFTDLDYTENKHGVPVLSHLPNRLVLERLTLLDTGGDHVCVTTEVIEAEADREFEALRLEDVQHVTPGRQVEERAVHP